jgi:hypothetical protein
VTLARNVTETVVERHDRRISADTKSPHSPYELLGSLAFASESHFAEVEQTLLSISEARERASRARLERTSLSHI